jgi:peptidylprolyl isomerase
MKIVLIVLAVGVILYFAMQFLSAGKAKENIELGQQFLTKNGNAEGVVTTASGLQYLKLEDGTGTTNPTATDRVKVHYHGTLIDGTVFDSSVDRGEPISFGLNQVIPGWTEGLQLMVEGDKTRFFIPSNLAYGNRAAGKITPGSTLIFDVELIGINAD